MSVVLVFVGLDFLREPDKSLFQGRALQKTSWQRLAEVVGPVLAVWFPAVNIENLRQKLVWAGEPWGISVQGFIGLKAMLLAGGVFAGFFLAALGLPSVFVPLLAVLAYLAPDMVLGQMVDRRQSAIYRDMPNMVGLVATAVKAGVELGPALNTVGEHMTGPLGEELRRAWLEISTSRRPRAASLREMAKRTGVPVVERFVETINTAEERGGMDISGTLSSFMADLRASQSRKAQEEARKIPTKLNLPLILCIFLPMLAMLLYPVVITVMDVL